MHENDHFLQTWPLLSRFSTIPVVAQPMSWGLGWVGCAAYESGVGVVIIRIKAISVQINLPTGTELGNLDKN